MTDFIVALVVLLIICMAIVYIVKEKKKGVRCIGCPAAGKCSGKCAGNTDTNQCVKCRINYVRITQRKACALGHKLFFFLMGKEYYLHQSANKSSLMEA